ncbi:acyl-CoA esterase, alpha/beta hydrolase family protein [Psychroflexus gondwanensis ACAM 44]|jgi:pimeloyl-ACP methyl ester carboxylesterase|uniref:Acyl-CoA esterase, alpha/beta hydrolase family protein n=1 Tax=Psychroflexus gondwanensis ACAM 44 TaxID=1189619 RepID=N1WZI8_9FLAO|nr:alpha/beta fold hydrolase [Psychroflexus gondwanensis]EMY82474.1 acyl-CoA esterase, alpha/beta hydrolase family protein [Psychroflexus gondwanensis ACAM 44]
MKLHSKIKGKGKPLVILHGFLGMGDNWKTLANAYAKEGFEVHLVDQRNHGRSPHDPAFSYELMAEDLKNYLEDKHLEKVSIIGHSMGGKVAMRFATLYPESLNRLIIVDIAPKYYPQHHQQILEGLTQIAKAKLTSRSDADELLAKYISLKAIRQFLLKNLYWKTPDELNLRINLQALKNNIEEVGKGLPQNSKYGGETLFLKGGNSDYIQDKDEKGITSHFENFEIKAIKNSGHWVHAEEREDFLQVSLEFLKTN